MSHAMFCYQCEQTAGGQACLKIGMCGKDAETSALQDLLIYQLEGISFYAWNALEAGRSLDARVHEFVVDALFATLTNVNFDPDRFEAYLRRAQEIKLTLRMEMLVSSDLLPAAAAYILPADVEAIQRDAANVDIRPYAERDADSQSLRDTLLYGLKGMAAYAHHARILGYSDDAVNHFFYKGLKALVDDGLTAGDLLSLLLELGQVNLQCMALLDKANTEAYGDPEPTQVSVARKPGPFIIVSGHDLCDLQQLLEQTAGTGVQVYTHGEMLPANAYPVLKKHPHLMGNYGSAWQNQQREFDGIPGCVLMTTNCLMEPREGYSDRIFTTGTVGWTDVPHIEERDGVKDFSPVIEKALELGGWQDAEPEKSVLTGFGHAAVLANAGAIVDAVKAGQIRHFFLVGGCDGARAGRDYYKRFAEQTPDDTVILTLGCGKYRFNKQEFGTVAGLPRLLDMGQCNDAYSAIQVALALADAFDCGVNELPLSLVLSWYEQKAVCILLTLLSLGIKNIYLGPTLPAFITPHVLQTLVDQYQIHPITLPEIDRAAMLA